MALANQQTVDYPSFKLVIVGLCFLVFQALANQQTVDYPSFKLVIVGDGRTDDYKLISDYKLQACNQQTASCSPSKVEDAIFNRFKLLVISFTVLLLVLKVAILLRRLTRKIVESPAVVSPEIHIEIELAAQQQDEAELAAAASQPLPDDDGDEFA